MTWVSNLGEKSCSALLKNVPKSTNLKNLSLILSDNAALPVHIWQGFRNFKNLTNLESFKIYLANNIISNITDLFESLKSMNNLKKLSICLRENSIGNDLLILDQSLRGLNFFGRIIFRCE